MNIDNSEIMLRGFYKFYTEPSSRRAQARTSSFQIAPLAECVKSVHRDGSATYERTILSAAIGRPHKETPVHAAPARAPPAGRVPENQTRLVYL
ncbi:hypothetical protein EVAR_51602_1 [Eumeta japonica]|uniref:Uncharacterized protein n=1 Tax=Eumeta variegata TaxID=151549 RepID=A0A4C1YGC5_EUMVA|nr:hypothetical protein EVAR_51602_1 [Eumeta japonica]